MSCRKEKNHFIYLLGRTYTELKKDYNFSCVEFLEAEGYTLEKFKKQYKLVDSRLVKVVSRVTTAIVLSVVLFYLTGLNFELSIYVYGSLFVYIQLCIVTFIYHLYHYEENKKLGLESERFYNTENRILAEWEERGSKDAKYNG